MYLVQADRYQRGPSPKKRSSKRDKQHTYEEWIKMRHKNREADIGWKTRTKAIYDFLRRVMPDRPPPNINRELPSPSPEPVLSEK